MAKILVGGAGGAPSNNFIKSLRVSKRNDYIVGTSCIPSDLFLADADERFLIPPAVSPQYPNKIEKLLKIVKPEFVHFQNDFEVRAISRIRSTLERLGIKLFLPKNETVENCVDKRKSYDIWKTNEIKVPETILICNCDDLKHAFNKLGKKIWIRAIEGGGGRGALPTNNFEFAKNWIDYYNGWGEFTASELLSEKTVTWQSIWNHGDLIVAQSRRRLSWNFGNRTLSGVTGITGVGETFSDPIVDRVAQDSIFAIDNEPHGIFSVDMTYDHCGFPNPTEINIGRFFTTHYFFTKAGLNFPEIYCDIALDEKFPSLPKKINPLPDGLIWIRGMDIEPVLTTKNELERMEKSML